MTVRVKSGRPPGIERPDGLADVVPTTRPVPFPASEIFGKIGYQKL
jgi:hypothetical protein